ncbi:MAG: endonuclease/exonuclease/phosphatase family protein, partial [Syntrophothermus sp.]
LLIMKFFLITGILWFSTFIACGQAAQPVKVMTFNIRYDNPGDSIYSWKERKEKVFRMLRLEKLALIGMQEVLKNQAEDLLTTFPQYKMTGVGRDDGREKGEYAPIFYDTVLFKKVDGSTFWLSQTPTLPGSRSWNSACTRIVTWAKFQQKNGRDFYFFNTHFDHMSSWAREESARMVIRAIDSIVRGSLVILTGDFNETDTSKMYRILTTKLAKAASFIKIPSDDSDPEYTFIGFPFHPEKGNEIDFVFVNKDADAVVHYYHSVNYNENGLFPSDHLPVVTGIQF